MLVLFVHNASPDGTHLDRALGTVIQTEPETYAYRNMTSNKDEIGFPTWAEALHALLVDLALEEPW